MKTFVFDTTATMKEYNSRNWWIDSGVVRQIRVEAESVAAALELYREAVKDRYYIDISRNALLHKSPMFVDLKDGSNKQVGYVITGKMDFYRDDGSESAQYIDLWVNVYAVVDVDF